MRSVSSRQLGSRNLLNMRRILYIIWRSGWTWLVIIWSRSVTMRIMVIVWSMGSVLIKCVSIIQVILPGILRLGLLGLASGRRLALMLLVGLLKREFHVKAIGRVRLINLILLFLVIILFRVFSGCFKQLKLNCALTSAMI